MVKTFFDQLTNNGTKTYENRKISTAQGSD